MKFAHVELLFLVWALPVLLLLVWHTHKRRRSILARFASSQALARIAPGAAPGRRIVKSVLLLLALASLVVALAGPQYGYTWQTIERKGVSLVVALDCSKSMLASDIKPDRLKRAKREILDLLGMLQGDKIGLVAFAGTAFLQCPLTLDYSAFNIFLDALSPDFLPVGGTDLAGAINTSVKAFATKANSDKAVILITDGESTTPGVIDAAKKAAEENIKIFCIGVGSPEGAPVPDGKGGFTKDTSGNTVHTRLDEDTLKKVAAITGGSYVRSVTGDMDLDAIYKQQIRSSMKSSTLETNRRKLYTDRYQWFLGLAVFFLLLELLLPASRRVNGLRNGSNGATNQGNSTAIKLAMFALLAGSGLLLVLALSSGTAHAAHADIKKGVEAFQKDDYKTALDAFLKAQIDDPDNPTLLFNVGGAHYKLEHYKDALNNYQAALERIPGATDAGLAAPPAAPKLPGQLAKPGAAPGRMPSAPLGQQAPRVDTSAPAQPGQSADKTVALPPESQQLAERTLYNMGNASYRLNQLPEAVHYYEKALQLDPKDEDARKNLEFVKKKLQQEQPKSCDNPQQSDKNKGDKSRKDKKDKGQQGKDKDKDKKDQDNKDKQQGQQDKNDKQDNQDKGQQDKDKDKDQQQQPDSGSAQQQKEQQKQDPKQDQEDPKFGSRMDKKDLQQPQQPEKADQQQAAQASAAKPEQKQPEDKNAGKASVSSPLNRLQDKPGRAMLPNYQPRRVEKDW